MTQLFIVYELDSATSGNDAERLRELAKDESNIDSVLLNPNTPEDVFITAATSTDVDRRAHTAGSPATPDSIKAWLVEDQHYLVREAIAKYSDNKELLEKLENDESVKVIAGLAQNENAPLEFLIRIGETIEEQHPLIRSSYAMNGKAPVEFLNKLANDSSATVIECLTYNSAPISETQKIIIRSNQSTKLRKRIAQNTKDGEVLTLLWTITKSKVVREAITKNPASVSLNLS